MLHRYLFKNRVSCASAAMIAMFVMSVAAHGGGVLYVDDDAPPGGDGTSWNTAYRFLQDGLTDACAGGIAEIRVGQGTYTPDRDEANPDGTGDREATFQLCNGVALMGGYAGFGAKDPDDRDTELYETILSGDLLDNDGPDFENNDENSYHVVTHTGTDNTAVLEGTTITAGNANGPGFQDSGGGVFDNAGSATLTNCTLRGNSAASSGGGMFNFGSPTLTNCTFIDNISGFSGGGIFSEGGLTLTGCTFTQNSAIVHGGGMYIFFSSPMLTNCTFKGNLAGSEGGGIWSLGGTPTLTNCMLSGNIAATDGGGMFNDNASPTLTNCTFSGNNAGISGGAMYNTVSSPDVTNGILWGNGPDQIFDFGGVSTVSYSDVEGGYAGAGNIDADPLFVDDASGDLHLSAGSPCIDAANNFAVPFFIRIDLDGNPRFVDDPDTKDTGLGDPPIVDMGAYEFQLALCPWDLDDNGSVGASDLLSLLVSWGPCKGCPADFDGNGSVGASDLLALLVNWGPCP